MIPFTLILVALGIIFVVGTFLVELECFGWATIVLVATVAGVQYLHVADILAFVSQNIVVSFLYTIAYLAVGVTWSFVKWFSFLMKFRDKFRELKKKFLDLNKIPSNSTSPNDTGISYAVKSAFEKYLNLHSPTNVKVKIVGRRSDDLDHYNEPEEQVASHTMRNNLWVSFLDESKTPNNQTIPTTLTDSFEVFLREQHSYGDYATLRNGKKPTAAENKARITSWMAFWPCSVIGTIVNDPVRRVCRFLFNTFKAFYQRLADAVFANDPELK